MISVFLGFALLASAISVNKLILYVLPPIFFVGVRMLGAGLILFGLTARKTEHYQWSYLKQDLAALFLVGFCTTYVTAILKAYALKNLASGKMAFIGSLDPFVAALLSYILWRERLTKSKWIGLGVAFAGMLLLTALRTPEETLAEWGIFSLAEVAAITSVVVGRYGWIIAAEFLKKHRYSSMELNALSMSSSGFMALLTAGLFEPFPTAWNVPWSPTSLGLLLAYTIIIGNVIAYNIYGYFLKTYTPTFVALAGFSVPLCVTTYGWLFLGEIVSWGFILAAGIILLGVAIFYLDELRAKTS